MVYNNKKEEWKNSTGKYVKPLMMLTIIIAMRIMMKTGG